MRYTSIILFFLVAGNVQGAQDVPSYQEAFDQHMEARKAEKSSISEEDKATMQQASKRLAVDFPEPGILVGDLVPDFTLGNANGVSVNLYEELKKGPVVLVFYRGAWCPYCNLHLKVLVESLPQFEEFGAQLIAVTPQTPDKSATQIEEKKFSFEVLSDLDSEVMKNFNLYFEVPDDLVSVYKKFGIDLEAFNGEGRNVLPVPGTFVIDQKGVVRAMHANTDYKSRMEPAAIRGALLAISKGE